jgi:hypothetical protein
MIFKKTNYNYLIVFIFSILFFISIESHASTHGLQRGGWDNRFFKYNGEFKYIVGIDLQQLACDKNIDFRAKIDLLTQYGINNIRIWLSCSFLGDIKGVLFPYTRQEGKFDLESWDDEYWLRLKEMVSYAESKNIIVEVSIFEVHGLEEYYKDDSKTPYYLNEKHNIQRFGIANRRGKFIPEFFNLYYSENKVSLQSLQKKLIDKTISELEEFNNVYYELMNEFPGTKEFVDDGRVYSWAHEMAKYIKSKTKKIVTLHAHGYGYHRELRDYAKSSSFFWNKPYVDGLNFHLYSADPNWISLVLHSHQQKGKLLICNEGGEYYDIDRSNGYPNYRIQLNKKKLNDEIRAAWGYMTAGGYFKIYHGPVPQLGANGWDEIGQFAEAMSKIVGTIPFWNMRPIQNDGTEFDSIVTQGPTNNWQVIADNGSAYLIYFWGPKTNKNVELSITPGNYSYLWYDVRAWKTPLKKGKLNRGNLEDIPIAPADLWDQDTGIVLIIKSD